MRAGYDQYMYIKNDNQKLKLYRRVFSNILILILREIFSTKEISLFFGGIELPSKFGKKFELSKILL